MLVGWRNITRRPGRLLTTVVAFTLAIVISLIIRGFGEGLYATHTGLVRNTAVDLWVSQSGSGLLPASLKGQLESIPEVDAVTPLWAVPVMADIAGRKIPMTLHGYDSGSGIGGPWKVAEGRAPAQGSDEIALDATLARQRGLKIGDRFELQGQSFQITGLTAETNSFMAYLAFTGYDRVGTLLGAPGQSNYLLVNLKPGMDVEAVRSKIPAAFTVQTPADVRVDRENAVTKVMGAPLRLLEWVAMLVGLAVIALTTYSGVLERRMEYGVLRALGMSGIGIAGVMLTEVAVGAVIGVVAGGLTAIGVAWGLSQGVSPYPILITGPSIGRAVGLGLVMGLVAAFMPLRQISTADPAAVFRA